MSDFLGTFFSILIVVLIISVLKALWGQDTAFWGLCGIVGGLAYEVRSR
jgi:hypothetical protein